MTEEEVTRIRDELAREYPGANITVTEDRAEIVAEIEPKRAVAQLREACHTFTQGQLRSTAFCGVLLYVAYGGQGQVLGPGQSLTIEPGNVHFARGAGGPAWIEVLSEPAWTAEDHLVL